MKTDEIDRIDALKDALKRATKKNIELKITIGNLNTELLHAHGELRVVRRTSSIFKEQLMHPTGIFSYNKKWWQFWK